MTEIRNPGMDELATSINMWANSVFPNRTDASMFMKLYGEVAELVDATDDECEGEVADILIMVLDFAKRKNIDITMAVTRKMLINMGRKWEIGPNGTMRHVE